MSDGPNSPSRRYQDYVIKEGRLIGEFEAMYQNASEVPWHQDKTAYELFCEFDLAILRHFNAFGQWRRVLDVGCGLGYLTARLQLNLPEAEVHGIDVSDTAIRQARALHPAITYHAGDLRRADVGRHGSYDLLFVKDLLWYVLPDLATVISNLRLMLRPGGWLYVSQSVPGLPDFYGSDLFPDPDAIVDYFAGSFDRRYASSTYERSVARTVGVYDLDKYARFLGTTSGQTGQGCVTPTEEQ